MIVPKNLDSRVNCFWTFSSEKSSPHLTVGWGVDLSLVLASSLSVQGFGLKIKIMDASKQADVFILAVQNLNNFRFQMKYFFSNDNVLGKGL